MIKLFQKALLLLVLGLFPISCATDTINIENVAMDKTDDNRIRVRVQIDKNLDNLNNFSRYEVFLHYVVDPKTKNIEERRRSNWVEFGGGASVKNRYPPAKLVGKRNGRYEYVLYIPEAYRVQGKKTAGGEAGEKHNHMIKEALVLEDPYDLTSGQHEVLFWFQSARYNQIEFLDTNKYSYQYNASTR